MIKANELRIGNLFFESSYGAINLPYTGQVMKVLEIMHFVITAIKHDEIPAQVEEWTTLKFNELHPIPLTEEWLLKFGFEKWQDNQQFQNYVLPNDKNFGINTPHFSGKKYIEGKFYYSPTDREIKTVHQLQNFYFALTGEELTINRAASIADSANINAYLMPGDHGNREHHSKV